MDMFAAEIGKDPAEVRRINLIPKFLEPHTTSIGQTYDVGDFETALDKALDAADYTGAARRAGAPARVRRRQAARHRRQRLRRDHRRRAADRRQRQGRDPRRRPAIVYTGTSPHGQGHATACSMIASEQTGIPMDRIDARLGRHRPRPGRWRHDGITLAAAGRRGGQQGRDRARREGAEARRSTARGRRGRRRARQGRRRVPRRRHAGASPRPGPISPSRRRPTVRC